MKEGVGVLLWLLVLLASSGVVLCKKKPNIIFILADDWGWGDTGWSEYADIPTPRLAEIRSQSLELMRFYTQPKCTAARAALMTGRYPYKMGLQTDKVFSKVRNNTLDPALKLLPAYLKDQGYHTHMVGKWHLGQCSANATPIYRGFDTHFGAFYNTEDHFTMTTNGVFDWNWQNEPYWDARGTFNVHLITNHTQHMLRKHFTNDSTKDEPIFMYVAHLVPHKPAMAPEEYITGTACNDIPEYAIDIHGNNVTNLRRPYCGMVAAMDEGIGNITDTLRDLGVLDDFIIVVTSDNGGGTRAGASNHPLRGGKQTVYEGGTRVRCLLRAPKFLKENHTTGEYHGAMHMTDWLPTLARAAGADPSQMPPRKEIDGRNAWRFLMNGLPAQKEWMVYNIDSNRQLGALHYRSNFTHIYKFIYSERRAHETGYRYQDPRPAQLQLDDPKEPFYSRDGQSEFLYDPITNEEERPPGKNVTVQPYKDIFDKLQKKLRFFRKQEKDVPTYYLLAKYKENGHIAVAAGCDAKYPLKAG